MTDNGLTILRRTGVLASPNEVLKFNIGNHAEGLYLVKIITENGTQTVKVILKR